MKARWERGWTHPCWCIEWIPTPATLGQQSGTLQVLPHHPLALGCCDRAPLPYWWHGFQHQGNTHLPQGDNLQTSHVVPNRSTNPGHGCDSTRSILIALKWVWEPGSPREGTKEVLGLSVNGLGLLYLKNSGATMTKFRILKFLVVGYIILPIFLH